MIEATMTSPWVDIATIGTRLLEVVSKRSGPMFHIVIAQIDPDAIGSAFGMQELLRVASDGAIESRICKAGGVGHPQNEALINKYNLLGKMTPVEQMSPPDQGDPSFGLTNVILVDSNRSEDSRLPFDVDPLIVVDHHAQSDVVQTEDNLVWLDESVGAASTLIVELFQHIAPEHYAMPDHIASMLALGIYSDTKSMTRAGPRDQAAYLYCKRFCNYNDLISLILYKRPFSFLENLASAVRYVEENDSFRQGRIVASLGRIPAKRGDDLAMIADEFLRTSGVTIAVSWAVIESKDSKSVRVCARSEDLTINLADFLRSRFGKRSGAKTLPDGAGEGGALVELDVGPWMREDEMIEIIGRRIHEWLFDEDVTAGDQ